MTAEIPTEHHETDVLIIGGGAAGTMAAFECAEAGVGVMFAFKSCAIFINGIEGISHVE